MKIAIHSAIVMLILSAAPTRAAENDWSNLAAMLKSGDRIDVVLADMKSLRKVTFQNATADELVVATDSGNQTLAKANVFRVTALGSSHRVRNAVILGVVGGLGGAAIKLFGASCAETDNGCRDTVIATVVGAGAGAGIGAALPATGRTVYRSK